MRFSISDRHSGRAEAKGPRKRAARTPARDLEKIRPGREAGSHKAGLDIRQTRPAYFRYFMRYDWPDNINVFIHTLILHPCLSRTIPFRTHNCLYDSCLLSFPPNTSELRPMSNINVQFGKAVRRLRKRRAWSQEKLAELSGLHWTYIGRIERGKQNISLANVGKIARALKITVEKMFKGIR